MRRRRIIPVLTASTLVVMLAGCASVPPPAPVPVSEVIRLSREGDPPEQIIQRMRDAGMVYRLEASQLAHLHQQGVPDVVLNYMQHTYLDAVRRDQHLQDWNLWRPGPNGYFYGGCYYGWPYNCY
jgi:hypothetical protein